MKGIFLLLGTNLGDRLTNLQQATAALKTYEMTVADYSSIYESAPWGDENQGWFLNMVLRVDTIHNPESLLNACLSTEIQLGRKRYKKWGERLIDIDLLYYDNFVLETEKLILPHPGIPLRQFTLQPLVEVAPHELHPVLNLTQKHLLDICPDHLECRKTEMTIKV